MFLKRTDVAAQLRKVRNKELSDKELIASIDAILKYHKTQDQGIQGNLQRAENLKANNFDIDLLHSANVFHISHIKKICIDYRLRFLSTAYFKGEIPLSAINAIKSLEEEHNIKLKGFKIIAPSKLFRLKDKDDPLLFAPLGNNYYYLVHKWGNDMHPLRKLMVWPFKNIVNLTIMVVLISYCITYMVPEGLFSKQNSAAEFWIIFLFFFKSIAAIVIFYGFALGKNFNPAIWSSKFLK